MVGIALYSLCNSQILNYFLEINCSSNSKPLFKIGMNKVSFDLSMMLNQQDLTIVGVGLLTFLKEDTIVTIVISDFSNE